MGTAAIATISLLSIFLVVVLAVWAITSYDAGVQTTHRKLDTYTCKELVDYVMGNALNGFTRESDYASQRYYQIGCATD